MKRVVEGGAKRPIVRRRSFTREFKRRVVKESLAPGASVSGVALRHRLNTNLLFTWRRQYLRELAGVQSVNLLPVKIDGAGSIADSGHAGPAFRLMSGRRSGACRAGCDAVVETIGEKRRFVNSPSVVRGRRS